MNAWAIKASSSVNVLHCHLKFDDGETSWWSCCKYNFKTSHFYSGCQLLFSRDVISAQQHWGKKGIPHSINQSFTAALSPRAFLLFYLQSPECCRYFSSPPSPLFPLFIFLFITLLSPSELLTAEHSVQRLSALLFTVHWYKSCCLCVLHVCVCVFMVIDMH